MKLTAFEVIVLFHPDERHDYFTQEKTKIIYGPTIILGSSIEEVKKEVEPKISYEYMQFKERIEIIVRPFVNGEGKREVITPLQQSFPQMQSQQRVDQQSFNEMLRQSDRQQYNTGSNSSYHQVGSFSHLTRNW